MFRYLSIADCDVYYFISYKTTLLRQRGLGFLGNHWETLRHWQKFIYSDLFKQVYLNNKMLFLAIHAVYECSDIAEKIVTR